MQLFLFTSTQPQAAHDAAQDRRTIAYIDVQHDKADTTRMANEAVSAGQHVRLMKRVHIVPINMRMARRAIMDTTQIFSHMVNPAGVMFSIVILTAQWQVCRFGF